MRLRVGQNAEASQPVTVGGFTKLMRQCRLCDRISFCDAPSITVLISMMSGSLWKLIKDFWIMVPNSKALDSRKVKVWNMFL